MSGAWLAHDLRVAWRVLRQSPGVTVVSVLSLIIGIAVTTAAFSVADGIFLRPLAVREPHKLLSAFSRGDDGQPVRYGWPDYQAMAAAVRGRAEVVAYQGRGTTLSVPGQDGEAELMLSYAVTPNFFGVLGVAPTMGELSLRDTGGDPPVVIGWRLWRRLLGGDRQAIGRTLLLGDRAFRVAGVLPEQFTGLQRGVAYDVYISMDSWFDVLGNARERTSRDGYFDVAVRPMPGADSGELESRLDAAMRAAGGRKPAPAGSPGTYLSQRFAPGWKADMIIGGGLMLLLVLVLFTACANVAQLRLAQGEARRRELGVRMALGAAPSRIVGQLMVETALIAVPGVVIGVVMARWLTDATTTLLAAGRSYLEFGIRTDERVLAFAAVATVFTMLVAGLAPARRSVRLDIVETVKANALRTAGSRSERRWLVASQMAATVALFGLAVLFFAGLCKASSIRSGLDPDRRLLAMFVARPRAVTNATAWADQLAARLAGVPGVRNVTYARRLPMSGSGGGFTVRVEMPGRPAAGVHVNHVAGNWFSTVGMRVLAGRAIDSNDRPGTASVMAISEYTARQWFPNGGAIGAWVSVGGISRQIVGVVEDGRNNNLREAREPYIYLPWMQAPFGDFMLVVETGPEPETMAETLRRELRRVNPGGQVYSTTTVKAHVATALAGDRTLTAVAAALGIACVLLTATGLFGLLRYVVASRRREFGVRLAIGAEPSAIRREVLWDALRLAAYALPAGVALLAAGARAAESLVIGVTAADPGIYLSAVCGLLVIAVGAAWLPALQATRIDPMEALRCE
jgi:predicted permease